jgi:hypothetical protein
VEDRYERLKGQGDSLQFDNRNYARIFQDFSDQVIALVKRFDSYCISCQEEEAKLKDLQQKRMKLEAVVRHFENNNEEYLKIGKKVEEELINVLSDPKILLMSALWSLVKSMRNDPEKFSSLIYYDTSPARMDYNSQFYGLSHLHGQYQQYSSKEDFTKACAYMLIEEADKLFGNVAKEFLDKIINDYSDRSRTPSSLPSLPPPDEENV